MNRNLLAQVNLEEAYKISPGGKSVASVYGAPADLINVILPNIFVLVGVVLLIYIFIAGFRMVSQPGNKGATDSARKSLTYAVTGFLLLFASYWIMQIVEFYTGVSILGR